MTTGLFIGRFQPFHLGHLEAVKYCLSKCDYLYIGIGSSNKDITLDNPFTAPERRNMIFDSVYSLPRGTCTSIIDIPDAETNEEWIKGVDARVTPYDIVYSGNPFTLNVFEQFGKEVEELDLLDREIYSGTNIRHMILNGNEWKQYVPIASRNRLIQLDAHERLRHLNKVWKVDKI